MTFYAKGASEPSAAPLDYSKHRELDHTLISACSRSSVQDVRSRQTLQIGRTTHYIQEVHLRVPMFRRRPRPAPRGFPRAVWQDSELCSMVLANLIDTLERRLYGHPQIVNVHLYDPLNVRVPPSSRRHDEVGLFLDMYFDGSHEPPNFENGFAKLEAGLGFCCCGEQALILRSANRAVLCGCLCCLSAQRERVHGSRLAALDRSPQALQQYRRALCFRGIDAVVCI